MTIINVSFIKRSTMIGCLLLWICTTLMLARPIYAQSSLDVSVSPSTAYLRVPPGTKQTHIITLSNSGQKDMVLKPTIVDFFPDGKTGQPVLSTSTTFPYFDLDQGELASLTVPAGKKAQLSLIIQPPKTAAEVEWPLTVLFKQEIPLTEAASMIDRGKTTNSSSQVTGTIGSNLVVLISNQTELPYLLKTESIKVPILIDSFRDVKVEAVLKNNGVAAVVASGSAQLVNMFGKTVTKQPLYPDTILGHSARAARIASPRDLDRSTHNQINTNPNVPSQPLSPQPLIITNRILLGPHQLIINITNPTTGQVDSSSATFFALPLSIILLSWFGGGLYLLYRYKFKKSS